MGCMMEVNSVFQQKHVWDGSGQASANNSHVEESLARKNRQISRQNKDKGRLTG